MFNTKSDQKYWSRLLSRLAAGLMALGVCASGARGQLVVGNDASGGLASMVLINLADNSTRTLETGIECWCAAADEVHRILYWTNGSTLYKADYTLTGGVTPVSLGGIGTSFTGMAYDSAANLIVGRGGSGFYTIDPSVGPTATLVFPISNQDFGGFDYDATTDAFYGTNDSTSAVAPMSGRGVYKISKPITAPTFTLLAPYPGSDTDCDGLAAGNGRLYLVNDGSSATEPVVRVYNLSSNSYEADLPYTWPTTTAIFSAGAWAPGMVAFPAGVDLAVTGGAPVNCAVAAGGAMAYSMRVSNLGADASAPVTLTAALPPASSATFASATPVPTTTSATELTFALGSIAGSAGHADVSISMTAVGAGATVSLTGSVPVVGDLNSSNNSVTVSSRITPAAPTVAAAKAIFSSNTALTNSNIAGGHFTTFDTPFVSPNGHWWAIRADTDLATASDSITVRGEVGGTSSVILQEGVTLMGNGAALGIYDPGLDLNDAGVVAFTGDDAAASQDEFVAKTDGTAVTDIAREGQTHAGITLATTASTGNAQVFANGNVAFSSTANPTTNNSYFTDNGTAVTARVGVTAPTGGGGLTVSAIVTGNLTNNGGCQYDATGTHSIYQANIGTVTATDQVIVADGTVVIQEGVTDIDGPGSYTGTPTSAVKIFTMGPTGMWMVRGLNSVATEDWVVRGNGATIAQVYKIGDAIHPGSSLHWADEGTTSFFSMTVDGNGHYVIGGFTDAASDFNDVVYVYDNKVILARENDPVDVDGNGMFDDGMYILSFGNDEVALLEDNTAIFTVSLRDADGALCELNNTSRGEALVSVKIPLGACCNGVLCASTLQVDCAGDPGNFKGVGTACGPSTCGAPANQQCCRGTTCVSVDSGTCTGTVGNSASLVVGSCGPHNQLARCCYADYDHSGTSTIDDLFIYINTWLVASPYTKIDGNTTAAPSIDDLFIFINLWLVGCQP